MQRSTISDEGSASPTKASRAAPSAGLDSTLTAEVVHVQQRPPQIDLGRYENGAVATVAEGGREDWKRGQRLRPG